jgi:hypothetical protein
VYAYNASTAIVSGQSAPTVNSGQLQATLAISGVYAGGTPAQSSYMGVYINQFVPETTNGSVAASGVFGGTYRLNAAQTSAGYLQSAESTADTGAGNAIYGTAAKGDAAAFMVFTPDQVNLNVTGNGTSTVVTGTRSTQAALDQTITLGIGCYTANNSSYYSVAAAVQQSTPSSLGVSRATMAPRSRS